jgi:hypothetical protein
MQTYTVYPKSRPSLDEVKQFVQSFPEGDWVMAAGVGRGVLECEDSRVYLDYDDRFQEYCEKYLGEQQRTALAEHLGFFPALALHIHASRAYQRSRELAQAVCESLVQKWGGGWSADGNPSMPRRQQQVVEEPKQ